MIATPLSFHPKPGHASIPAILAVLFALTIHPSTSQGFAKRLIIGADGGYSGTFLKKTRYPYVFDGGVLGAHLLYGITSTFGVQLDGSFDMHKDHVTAVERVVDSDGELAMAWVTGPTVTDYYVTTTALSLVYAVDVSRVVPLLSVGIVGGRIDRKTDGKHQADYGLGIRWGIGFDYTVVKHLALGAMIHSDRFYWGSDHERRIAFCIRASFLLDFKKSKKFGMNH